MTETDSKKPPPFWCPRCGQKHRADLSRLRPGVTMRTTCKGCGITLGVSRGADGNPVCTAISDAAAGSVVEATAGEAASASVTSEGGPQAAVEDGVTTAIRDSTPSIATAPPPEPIPEAVPPATAPPEGQDDFARDTRIGRYTIEAVIGRGGTGTVYRAFDPTTNRTVALKILNRGLSDTMRQRFLREIEVEANIRHQNIMPVFDRGELADGRPFFTMELLYEPVTLTEVVDLREQGKLHRNAALRDLEDLATLVRTVLIPIAEGVYVANVENGVIHRDLKPDNCLIDSRTHRPYLIDFGICQVLERREGLSSAVVTTTTDDAGILGTPRFLSPEQARGSAHPRTDVWGLGAILHFVVAGEPPIAGATPITRAELRRRVEALEEARRLAEAQGDERKAALCAEKLDRLNADGLRTLDDIFRDAREGRYGAVPATTPSAVQAILKKAMAPVPADRYVNARQLAADLEAWLNKGRVRALAEFGGTVAAVETARRAVRRHLVAGLWVLLGLGLGLGVGFLLGGGPKGGSSPPRLALIDKDIDGLKAESDQVAYTIAKVDAARSQGQRDGVVTSWTPLAEHLSWRTLETRAAEIEKRLQKEPESEDRASVLAHLSYVRGRFAPRHVKIDVPAKTAVTLTNADTGETLDVKAGENAIPPGLYRMAIGSDKQVQAPLHVPLQIRSDQDDPAREPALERFSLPFPIDQVPAGSVLVVGGTVRVRDLPFAEPTTPALVKPFLIDRREVTNAEYAAFLQTLAGAERTARTPTAGFSAGAVPGEVGPSPEMETYPVVAIRPEDARAYCGWRSQRDGVPVRLPTEAEWVLVAGGAQGVLLANGFHGTQGEGDLLPPLRPAGAAKTDVSDYGVLGLVGNAREMVLSLYEDVEAGGVLVKGGGVGDDPFAAAVYALRPLKHDERHPTTGFRCVREIPAP